MVLFSFRLWKAYGSPYVQNAKICFFLKKKPPARLPVLLFHMPPMTETRRRRSVLWSYREGSAWCSWMGFTLRTNAGAPAQIALRRHPAWPGLTCTRGAATPATAGVRTRPQPAPGAPPAWSSTWESAVDLFATIPPKKYYCIFIAGAGWERAAPRSCLSWRRSTGQISYFDREIEEKKAYIVFRSRSYWVCRIFPMA